MNVKHHNPQDVSNEQSKHFFLLFLIFCLITITSTILNEETLPQLSSGLFSIHIMDVLVLILTLAGVNRSFLSSNLGMFIFLMMLYCLLSCIYSVVSGHSDMNNSMRELRMMLLYLLSVPIAGKLASVQSFKRVYFLLLILGYMTAITMIVQYKFGLKMQFLAGRVEDLNTMGNITQGVTRILTPGHALIFFLFILNLSTLCFSQSIGKSHIFALINLAVLGIALLLTFNRSYWASSVLSIIPFLVFSGARRFMKGTLIFGALASLLLLVLIFSPNSKLLTAVQERFATITSASTTVKKDMSLTARKYEYIQAWKIFTQNPVVGLGLGAEWRKKRSADDTLNRYTHNGFLGLLVRFGIIGFLVFMMPFTYISVLFVRNVRHINNWPDKPKLIGALAFLLAVFTVNIVNPMFLQHFSIPLLAIALGYAFAFLKQVESYHTTEPNAVKVGASIGRSAEFLEPLTSTEFVDRTSHRHGSYIR